MRTMNPALNDEAFERAAADWAPPSGAPTTSFATNQMTLSGTLTATAVLVALLMLTAVFGWNSVNADPLGNVALPGWFFVAVIAGLGTAILTVFKPHLARFTAPAYAAIEGFVLGAISGLYNYAFDGIVLQAVGLTMATLAIMVFLYATRIVQVTDKLRMGIVMATGAIALMYLVTMVINLFGGGGVPFIHSTGTFGVIFSLVVVGVAAFNLLLDFDLIERGIRNGAPKHMEWYAAFGVMVTLVWLYLEMLRLLAKMRDR